MERILLRSLRKKKNFTQKELAEQLGISTVYVRKLESGDAEPGLKTAFKYEKFFNISMKKLFPDIF